MPTIKENGGAVRFWRQKHGDGRAVLCRNGVTLIRHGRNDWNKIAVPWTDIDHDPRWIPDTRPVITAVITRTNRDARRKS